jgi:hypothetical protein
MIYPLVLDLAADGVPVTVTCRVLGFFTQDFNKWRRSPVSQRDWDNALELTRFPAHLWLSDGLRFEVGW